MTKTITQKKPADGLRYSKEVSGGMTTFRLPRPVYIALRELLAPELAQVKADKTLNQSLWVGLALYLKKQGVKIDYE